MKKTLGILLEVTMDAFHSFTYFIKSNLITFANILNLAIPYAMYFIGLYVAQIRDNAAVGGEIFIPLAVAVLNYYLRSTANKLGKGITIPIPDKRFTQVDEDGEVSIEHNRIQELLLYMADIEDWMERKNLM